MKKLNIIKGKFKFAMKISILLLLMILMAPLTTGCYLFPETKKVIAPPLKEPQKMQYVTVEAKKQTLEKRYNFTAYFLPITYKDVYFKYNNMRVGDVLVKPGDMVSEGDLLVQADTSAINDSIKNKQLEIRKAEIDLAKLKSTGASQYAIENAELDLQLLNFQLENLQKELNKTTLYAPISGMVVYASNTLPKGTNYPVNKPIVRIADTNNLVLEYTANLSNDKESAIQVLLTVGMKADVKIKDKVYEGEVILTPVLAQARNDELNKSALRIKVNGVDQQVSEGDSAQVSILLAKKEDVLVIRNDLIRKFKNTNYVRVLENDSIVDKVIELGMQTETESEVTKGLNPGDKIIVQ